MADLPAVRPLLPAFDGAAPVRSVMRTLYAIDEIPGQLVGRAFGWLQRNLLTRPTDFQAGMDFASDIAHDPRFDVQTSMSALGEFAWVYAGANAIAADLQRLPLRVSIGRGRKARLIENHPVTRLLRNPSARTRGSLFRRQRMVDFILAGFRYSLKVYPPGRRGPPESLIRLHPMRTRVLATPSGEVAGIEYGDKGQRFDFHALMHIGMPSWEDDPSALLGQGSIRALKRELNIDLAIQRNAEKSAKKGRPDFIVGPGGNDEVGGFSPTQTKELRAHIEEMFAAGSGGAAVSGRKLDVQKLGWSPVDLGALEQRGFTRSTILAVLGVPPVRMGLETANFATAQQQNLMYWGDTLQGIAAIDEEDWTELAREFPDSEDVEVWYDFSGVPALQDMETARLARISTHISNGMEEEAAYDYEGLSDAPIGSKAPKPVADPPSAPAPVAVGAPNALSPAQVALLLDVVALVASGGVTPAAALVLVQGAAPTLTEQDARTLVDGAIALPPEPAPAAGDASKAAHPTMWRRMTRAWLVEELREMGALLRDDDWLSPRPVAPDPWLDPVTRSGEPSRAPVPPTFTPEEKAARDTLWRGWAEKVHARAELRIKRKIGAFLREQHARVVSRLPEERKGDALWLQRNVVDELLNSLFPSAYEDEQLAKAIRDVLRRAVEDGFKATADGVGEPLAWEPTRIDRLVDSQLAEMVVQVNTSTKAKIRDLVVSSRSQGETMNELQARIQKLSGDGDSFAPSRALRIARTETTESIEAGNQHAYKQAQAAGIALQKEWLAARDSHVRPEHAALDGTTIDVDGEFEIGTDRSAYPGGFSQPKNSVNCRCTTRPKRVEA